VPLRTFLSRLIWLCVLPLLLLAAYLAFHHVRSLQAQYDRQAQDLARNVATAIDRHLDARIAALQMLAASPLLDDPDRWPDLYREALGYLQSFGSHVVFADSAMQMRFNTRVPYGQALPKLPTPKGHAAAPEALATGQPAVGDLFMGPIAKEPLVAVVVPVLRENQARFLLLTTLEAKQLQQRLDQIALPEGWVLALRDSQGEAIARRLPPGTLAAPDRPAGAKGHLSVPIAMARWSVTLDVPAGLYNAPIVTATLMLAAAILMVTLISVLGGRLAGRRLGRAVESLLLPTVQPPDEPRIAEIEAVSRALMDAAAGREKAEAIKTEAEKAMQHQESLLRESEHKFRMIIENSRDIIYTLDADGHILFISPAIRYLLGYEPSALVGRHFQAIIHPDDASACMQAMRRIIETGTQSPGFEYRALHVNGEYRWHTSSGGAVHDAAGNLIHFQGVARDITERRKLEEQLRQSQKMESVGRLAGGVAHDYNNMLSVILGYTEMALSRTAADDPLHADLEEILHASRRSADITRQLLAFARRQTIAPEVLDLNADVEKLLKMLRRLIGEDIDLAWLPGASLWTVRMDPSQLNQILANLCVNARDAIADVGKITIETRNTSFDEAYCANHPGFLPGDFVQLAVSDNGSGMDKETLSHLFEPFFTTKGVGRGTGLGLATVYGIVKQNDGFINVYSEPAKGSSFRIYLPRHAGQVAAESKANAGASPKGRGETVLVVEDEAAILKLTQKILERLGYRVLTAGAPAAAIALAGEPGTHLHLLITDVVMPGMNGRELADRLRQLYPGLNCLFMSGYTADAIAHHGVLDQGVLFIQKPFSTSDLARKARQALDHAGR
jgi:PAS domain S-box-containing protein